MSRHHRAHKRGWAADPQARAIRKPLGGGVRSLRFDLAVLKCIT